LLAAQARAVIGHDAARLRTVLDPSAAARRFRTEQLGELANLRAVPLAGWGYTVIGQIRDRAAERAATLRYRAPVLLLHVTLGYRLRGVDALPSRHDLYLSFVARDRHTYLAGDDALATEGMTSWTGPWHYGPLAVAKGHRTLVVGPQASQRALPGLASAADAAVTAVTAVWGTGWTQRVAVVVPASTAEFDSLTGTAARDVSAAALTEGVDAASGEPYGQRLVLDPSELPRLTAAGRAIVMRHEVTHLAAAPDTADITPRWLVEGFADYVAERGIDEPVRRTAAELHAAVAAGRVPQVLPQDSAFDATGTALAGVYEQSWLACRLIAERVGVSGLVRFYRDVGTALEPQAQAVADAFGRVLHETQGAFTAQWRAYLKTELS
jgi:hypothetical protein